MKQAEEELTAQRAAVKRYWDAHPIATDSVAPERGTRESFEAIHAAWVKGMNPARLEFLEMCRDRKVLEIGCGIAMDGRFLSENGIDYRAIDLSRESLKLARRHFEMNGLTPRFTNADATRIPFDDETFGLVYSIGVLHHVPEMARACREAVRVLEPGGTLRVMFYHRHSYHYALVSYVVRPLIWLLLHLPGGAALAARGPAKFRSLFEICARHGFGLKRLLDASTDTSEAGEDAFNPHSAFVTRRELRELFGDLEGHRFLCRDLKYYPLPFLRKFCESRFGFFLTMTAQKPRS